MRNRAIALGLAALALGLSACASQKDVFDLQVGHCMNSADITSEQLLTAPTVSCRSSHDLEIFATVEMEGTDYPGPDAATNFAKEWCHSQFEGFVGAPYENSRLTVSWIHPSRSSWEQRDDRTVLCILGSPEAVTGTFANSGL